MFTIAIPPRLHQFLNRYGRWILAFAALDVGLWLAFEWFFPAVVGEHPG